MGDNLTQPDPDPIDRFHASENTSLVKCRGKVAPTSCFQVLQLPPEIRNMIYKELVVVGVVSYSQESPNEKPSQLALLRVCKQIHAEAEPLYLRSNLFKLPLNWISYRPFTDWKAYVCAKTHRARRQLFSNAGLLLIRKLCFAFNSSQLEHLDIRAMWDNYEYDNGAGLFHTMTDAERKAQVYGWQHSVAMHNWDDVQFALCRFKSTMDYVHVDFADVFCPQGCCRPIKWCVDQWITRLAPKRVVITGLRAGEKAEFGFCDARLGRRYTVDKLKAEFGLEFKDADNETNDWRA